MTTARIVLSALSVWADAFALPLLIFIQIYNKCSEVSLVYKSLGYNAYFIFVAFCCVVQSCIPTSERCVCASQMKVAGGQRSLNIKIKYGTHLCLYLQVCKVMNPNPSPSPCSHPAAHDSNSRNPITAAMPEAIVVATNLQTISSCASSQFLKALTQGISCSSKQAICPARSQTWY